MLSAHPAPIRGQVGDIDVNFGSTADPATDARSPMSMSDLQLTLRRLGFDRPGEVFWLTTNPEVTDEELALRLSCL